MPGVWPPVTIGGRRFIDGGTRSATNADVAAGADVVLVITPAMPGLPDGLEDEIAGARFGAHIVVRADAEAAAAFGVNPLHPDTRRPSALAGRALGRAEAARVAAVWVA